MEALCHSDNRELHRHLMDARRVLELPLEVSGLRWHPFGLYTAPLAKRTDETGTWSRRLHIWHPEAKPVGQTSPYGVHTHSGIARSHVLLGELWHHLYAFEADPDGAWRRAALGKPEGRARLAGHVRGSTIAGRTHTLPRDQPHGVTKPPGLAISLFEQLDGQPEQEFTTWQRTDMRAEALCRTGPVSPREAASSALLALDAVVAV